MAKKVYKMRLHHTTESGGDFGYYCFDAKDNIDCGTELVAVLESPTGPIISDGDILTIELVEEVEYQDPEEDDAE